MDFSRQWLSWGQSPFLCSLVHRSEAYLEFPYMSLTLLTYLRKFSQPLGLYPRAVLYITSEHFDDVSGPGWGCPARWCWLLVALSACILATSVSLQVSPWPHTRLYFCFLCFVNRLLQNPWHATPNHLKCWCPLKVRKLGQHSKDGLSLLQGNPGFCLEA